MRGAITPLPQYVFITWCLGIYLCLYIVVAEPEDSTLPEEKPTIVQGPEPVPSTSHPHILPSSFLSSKWTLSKKSPH
jgi:hypothetical protein